MRIVAISDTHAQHSDVTLPEGDVLVYGGDLMSCGRKFYEVQSFAQWWNSQPHKHKILVAGNHDRLFEKNLPLCLGEFTGTTYLEDSGCEIDGVKFWGSPVQPWFHDWAFNVHRGDPIKKVWDKIPEGTDVLITHGPPYGILDQMIPGITERPEGYPAHFSHPAEHLGCEELTKAIERVKPKVHIFGHIHGSYGTIDNFWYPDGRLTKLYNVAICDEQYNPANPATVIELER